MYYLLLINVYVTIVDGIYLFKDRENAVKKAIEYMKSTGDYTDKIGKLLEEEGYYSDIEENEDNKYSIKIIPLELED